MALSARFSARSIVTLAEVKLYIGTSANSSLDTTLETWIDFCSAQIEDYLGRKVVAQSVTEILDGDGGSFIIPEWTPIIALTNGELTDLQYRDSDGTGTWANLVDDIDLISIDAQGFAWRVELLGGESFPKGIKNIKLLTNVGWTDVPGTIRKVCLEMVQIMHDESKAAGNRLGKPALVSGSFGSGAVGSVDNPFTEITQRHQEQLDRFRRLI